MDLRERKGASPIQQVLSGVVVDGHEMGRRAVELLSELSDGRRPLGEDESEIVMPLEFHGGRTLGTVRDAFLPT